MREEVKSVRRGRKGFTEDKTIEDGWLTNSVRWRGWERTSGRVNGGGFEARIMWFKTWEKTDAAGEMSKAKGGLNLDGCAGKSPTMKGHVSHVGILDFVLRGGAINHFK